jgi:hypothetical protein
MRIHFLTSRDIDSHLLFAFSFHYSTLVRVHCKLHMTCTSGSHNEVPILIGSMFLLGFNKTLVDKGRPPDFGVIPKPEV